MDHKDLTLTKEYLDKVQAMLQGKRNCYPDTSELSDDLKFQRVKDVAQRSMNGALVPLRDQDVLAEEKSFEETPAILAVRDFLKEPRECWCLVLAGPPGRGKSIAAAYWLKRIAYDIAVENFETSNQPFTKQRWWSAQEVGRVSSHDQELTVLMQRDNIVIDDLGTEYLDKNGHILHRLDELITRRYSNYKRTLITTNLNIQGFKNRYGNRIFSRIGDGGIFHGLVGESYRGGRDG